MRASSPPSVMASSYGVRHARAQQPNTPAEIVECAHAFLCTQHQLYVQLHAHVLVLLAGEMGFKMWAEVG